MSQRMTLLPRVIRFYLSFIFWFVLVMSVALLIMTPFVIASAPSIEEADVGVVVGFVIDENALAGSSPRSEGLVPLSVEGEGVLHARSQSRLVWAAFLGSMLLAAAAGLVVIHQLRAVFRSVAGGVPFARKNVRRIKTVGWVVVAWQILVPVAKYLVGSVLVGEFSIRGITLKPPLDFHLEALFLGLAILVLAEVFRQASDLQREQSLTV